jgi:thiosulfate reductase cytochrome b subunit
MRPFLRRVLGLLPAGPYTFVKRHAVALRLSHWINALCLLVLLMSGLQIFNAHPALYWGESSDFAHPILSMTASYAATEMKGITRIGMHDFDTTGVLGASDVDGVRTARGFPAWATLPGPQWLAMGRLWHFAFAWLFVGNGVFFVSWAITRGHFKRDLLPTRQDFVQLPRTILDHLKLKFPKGEAARRYNTLQKLAYVLVIFGLGPLIVLTGLTMSPTMDSVFPGLLWLFGGRQTARTIHFLCAISFLGFFILHIVMVILSGAWNNLRAMITGRLAIEVENGHD